jgi:hypothetical protein
MVGTAQVAGNHCDNQLRQPSIQVVSLNNQYRPQFYRRKVGMWEID